MLQKYSNRLRLIILDEKRRQTFLNRLVYGTLGVLSLCMSVVNIFTDKQALLYSTAIFSGVCIADLILSFISPKVAKVALVLFQIEMMVLFTFFIYSGTPEGFSAFWAGILPLCGMFLWGIKRGAFDSFLMLLIIIFFCWTPYGNSLLLYDYTESFLLRFPLMYVAYFVISFLLCLVLFYVQNAYASQSKHDPLTKALNRTGLDEYMKEDLALEETDTVGFIIMDLDHFKNVNDTYGHLTGDKVLCHSVDLLSTISPYKICRWGGEEFAIYCKDGGKVSLLAKEIVRIFEQNDFSEGNLQIHQTISAGAVVMKREKNIHMDEISRAADRCLYEAKNTGRNKAVIETL